VAINCGYNFAGVATLDQVQLTRPASAGQAQSLEQRLTSEPLLRTLGIGHNCWATHGWPAEDNAHPHATDRLAVVHNDIIENFVELRREPETDGAEFTAQTGTEPGSPLVTKKEHAVLSWVFRSLRRLKIFSCQG